MTTSHSPCPPQRPVLDPENAAAAAYALAVSRLSKRFGAKAALDHVEFALPRGAFTVILGPAGAGKTTTLRMIAGLEKPDEGDITLHGIDAQGLEPKDRDIAMIFDNLALYPNKSGFENIASSLRIRGTDRREIENRVTSLAATLRITHVLTRLPKTMSGGERQRVALGRALIRTPQLFLLDEPLSSLDAKLRVELRAELKRLQREQGNTFLMATPDFTEAMAVADTIIMLREGRVVQEATPQELYDHPVDREVALFVGSPQITLLPACIAAEGVQVAGTTLPVPPHLRTIPAGETFELGIRPENLRLALPEEDAVFRGSLMDIEPLGLQSALTVGDADWKLRLLVDSGAAHDLRQGASMALTLCDSGRLLAFHAQSGLSLLRT